MLSCSLSMIAAAAAAAADKNAVVLVANLFCNEIIFVIIVGIYWYCNTGCTSLFCVVK